MTVPTTSHWSQQRSNGFAAVFPKHSSYVDFKLQETPQEFQLITALTVRMRPSSNGNLTIRNWFHSLPSQRFHTLLTLFPKSFSPFPHGTCLLSVSDQYLALEENYLPFCAPLPKYATLWKRAVRAGLQTRRDSHPLWCFLPKRLAPAPTLATLLKTTIQRKRRFTVWALPGSVALTKGIIFIFFSTAYLYA